MATKLLKEMSFLSIETTMASIPWLDLRDGQEVSCQSLFY